MKSTLRSQISIRATESYSDHPRIEKDSVNTIWAHAFPFVSSLSNFSNSPNLKTLKNNAEFI